MAYVRSGQGLLEPEQFKFKSGDACLTNSSRKITENIQEDIIWSVTLVGRVKNKGHINDGGDDNEGGVGVVTTRSTSFPERRTRGLPSPSSQTSQDMGIPSLLHMPLYVMNYLKMTAQML